MYAFKKFRGPTEYVTDNGFAVPKQLLTNERENQ